MSIRSLTRVALGVALRPIARRIHMDSVSPPSAHKHISELFSEMISGASGSHPSTDRITKFMNAVYMHQPRSVALFNVNYRTQTERATVKGLRVGTNSRRPMPEKNIILVSGLPSQDPSTISVNLYVAAMISRIQPMFPCDVSFIPLAHPREYERRLQSAESPFSQSLSAQSKPAFPIVEENITIETKDLCRPIEAYVTRRNKYYVNIEVDMNTRGSTMQYKSNSLAALSSKGKHRDFFSHPTLSSPLSSPSLIPEAPRIFSADTPLAPMLSAPSIVLELRSSQALDDDQVVERGEEVIGMMKQLLA